MKRNMNKNKMQRQIDKQKKITCNMIDKITASQWEGLDFLHVISLLQFPLTIASSITSGSSLLPIWV